MKRFILMIFFSCLILNVKAETFYTNYDLIEEKSLIYKEEYTKSELYKMERFDGYNNYKEYRVNEGYYRIDNAPYSLKYRDSLDYIYQDVYKRSNPSNVNAQYRTNIIANMKSIRYIRFNDFHMPDTILKAIKVYYEDEELNYEYASNNYNFKDKLVQSNEITIDLGAFYDLEKIKIKMDLYTDKLSRKAFMINVRREAYYRGVPYNAFENELFQSITEEEYIIDFKESNDFYSLLDKISWINKNNFSDRGVSYYLDQVKLYKHYNLKRDYLNIYTMEKMNGYKLDYNDHKYLYDYYKRDYIDVLDEINNKDDLKNIIISSSINKNDINISFYFNDENPLKLVAVFTYQDYTFFKKYKLNNDLMDKKEEIEKEIVKKEEKELQDNKTNNDVIQISNKVNKVNKNVSKKTRAITTTTMKKTINKEIFYLENCKSNYKQYFYISIIINLLLIIILFILMCKYLKNIRENK